MHIPCLRTIQVDQMDVGVYSCSVQYCSLSSNEVPFDAYSALYQPFPVSMHRMWMECQVLGCSEHSRSSGPPSALILCLSTPFFVYRYLINLCWCIHLLWVSLLHQLSDCLCLLCIAIAVECITLCRSRLAALCSKSSCLITSLPC